MLKAIGLAPYRAPLGARLLERRRAQGLEEPRQHDLAARDARPLRLRGVPLLPAARDELRPRRELHRGGARRARERRPRQQPRQPGEPHAEPGREAVRRRRAGAGRARRGRARGRGGAASARETTSTARDGTSCASTRRWRGDPRLLERGEPLRRRDGALEGREGAGRRAARGAQPRSTACGAIARASPGRSLAPVRSRRLARAADRRGASRAARAAACRRARRSSRASSCRRTTPDVDRQPLPRERRRVRRGPRRGAGARVRRRASTRCVAIGAGYGVDANAGAVALAAAGSARLRRGRRAPARRAAPRRRRARAKLRAWLGGAARRRGRRVRARLLVRALAARRAARRLRRARGARARARPARQRSTCATAARDAYEELLEIWRGEGGGAVDGRPSLLHPRPRPSRSAPSTRASSSRSPASSPSSSAEALREVAAALPLDRLLVETDAPLLAPQGHRGERNEPAHVALVGECLARAAPAPRSRRSPPHLGQRAPARSACRRRRVSESERAARPRASTSRAAAGAIQRERYETRLEIGTKSAPDRPGDRGRQGLRGADRRGASTRSGPATPCSPRRAAGTTARARAGAGSSTRSTAPPTTPTATRASASRSASSATASAPLGVVYDPLLDELYHAVRGGGRLPQRTADPRSRGGRARTLAARDRLRLRRARQRASTTSTTSRAFLKRTRALRRDGSAALDLCYVASGRLDGYWELKLQPWDVAAGALIVEEAGGRFSDFTGSGPARSGARGGGVERPHPRRRCSRCSGARDERALRLRAGPAGGPHRPRHRRRQRARQGDRAGARRRGRRPAARLAAARGAGRGRRGDRGRDGATRRGRHRQHPRARVGRGARGAGGGALRRRSTC